jgi:hypothetical protein
MQLAQSAHLAPGQRRQHRALAAVGARTGVTLQHHLQERTIAPTVSTVTTQRCWRPPLQMVGCSVLRKLGPKQLSVCLPPASSAHRVSDDRQRVQVAVPAPLGVRRVLRQVTGKLLGPRRSMICTARALPTSEAQAGHFPSTNPVMYVSTQAPNNPRASTAMGPDLDLQDAVAEGVLTVRAPRRLLRRAVWHLHSSCAVPCKI